MLTTIRCPQIPRQVKRREKKEIQRIWHIRVDKTETQKVKKEDGQFRRQVWDH